MDKQTLVTVKSILFKTFLTGLAFALIIFLLTMKFWDKWSFIVSSRFLLSQKELGELFVNSMLYTRFYLIFVILVPAIAIHWHLKNTNKTRD